MSESSWREIFIKKTAHSNTMKGSSVAFFFLLSILTTPFRCDTNSSSVNVTNNQQQSSSFSSSNKSIKSGSSEGVTATNDEQPNGQQIPLVRLPSNTLLKYTAYKDVSIQHFLIPMDTRSATFSFKSNEESKSALSELALIFY